MSEKICAEIKSTLRDLEPLRILYACESGSRAWGFPSRDSDYDVRFLYIRPLDWYLSIDEGRDVLEVTSGGIIDLSGWDIKKALRLLRKSNPPLLEWLNSPIVYEESYGVTKRLRSLIPEYYSPRSCLYHYVHMAKGNFRDYLTHETVWVKKYFYVLRPILACRWIESGRGVVPMEFQKLVERTIEPGPLKSEILALVDRKRAGEELDMGPRIPLVSNFIESEIGRLAEVRIETAPRTPSSEKLNDSFRWALNRVWNKEAS